MNRKSSTAAALWQVKRPRVQTGLLIGLMCLMVLTLFPARTAFGQTETGSIAGTVRDTSGALVPNATVAVRSTATGVARTVQSAADGGYTVPGLLPGTYDIKVSSSGFQSSELRAEVTVGARVTVDAQLSVSNQTTTVEVVAEGGAQANTQSQEISQVVTPEQIFDLPSLTRNPYDFVALAGNVSGGDRGQASSNAQLGGVGQNNTDRGVGFSINGQRSSGTEVLLDGAENTSAFTTLVALYIPQDAVQEFRVITNNYDAQYGRASGGVVSVVTKAGTNAFHGSGWEFNRLSAYTANTYDNVANNVPKGHYTRNQFGFAVGGPVVKDKLFFFASTEWLRVRSSASVLGYVATPQLIAAAAPNTQAFFAAFGKGPTFSSTVTKSALSVNTPATCATQSSPPPSCGIFDATIPNGTPVFGLVNYTAPVDAGGDLPQNTYDLVARVDYNFSSATQVFFRYGRENLFGLLGSEFASPYPQYNVGQALYDNSYLLSVSHAFSANLLSSTKLSFSRYNNPFSYDTSLQTVPTLFLYNNATVNNQQINLPGFFDASTATGGLPSGGPENYVQINEDLAWAKNAHTIRYGGQYNYIQLNQAYGAYAQANEQLGATQAAGLDNLISGNLFKFTGVVNPAGHFGCAVEPYSSDGTKGAPIVTPACTLTLPATPPAFARSDRYNDWALYAEDSWRVRPRLTINYGLRYEHYGVQHNNKPQLDSNFYYGSGSSYFAQVRNGQLQTAPNSPIGELWSPRWGTVGPRLGFAYDLFGNGATSLRGGFGISYERNFGNVTFNVIQNPPSYQTLTIQNTPVTNSSTGPLAGSAGTVVAIPVGSARNVDQNINVAQTQFWGLSIDHQFGRMGLISIEYNGAHGVHLYDIKNINELGGGQVYLGDPRSFGLPCDPTCLTRPNQGLTNVNNRGTEGFSHYNALNLRYQTRDIARTGVSLVANYTWAHELDNISSTFSESSSGSNGVGNLGYLDPRNPALDYASGDSDIRHRIVVSPVWETPWFKSGKGFERQALGGYTISGIFTARTGTPFTVSDSTNSLNAGDGGLPRYVPTSPITSFASGAGTPTGNPNDFQLLSLPAANHFTGLLGISDFGPYPANMTSRNNFKAPGAWSFDLSFAKSVAVTERVKLEFRAEAFDIFNHHNMYVNGFAADATNFPTGAVQIDGKKGGLGTLANNGSHDERRFGQFALRLLF
jgi:hypothetical protein